MVSKLSIIFLIFHKTFDCAYVGIVLIFKEKLKNLISIHGYYQ